MAAGSIRLYERDPAPSHYSFQNVGLVLLEDLPTRISPSLRSYAGESAPSSKANATSSNNQSHLLLSTPLVFSVWGYSYFLTLVLVFWVFYLILPKGVRKHYFGAYPKRYKKIEEGQYSLGHWIYPSEQTNQTSSVQGSTAYQVRKDVKTRGAERVGAGEESNSGLGISSSVASSSSAQLTNSSYTTPTFMRGKDEYYTGPHSSAQHDGPSSHLRLQSHSRRAQPSPEHPSIERIPSNEILSETMKRLKGKGVRLIAHGVKCEPKRVWIKLEEDTFSLTWQTEFPKRVPNQLGEISVVLIKGSTHKIALPNVLYIDVGKRTSALLKPETEHVPNSCFFSLLTQNGSLDLQTNSNLERDALVSCFSLILDQVHDRDWRHMYDEGSSVVSSSAATNKYPSDYVEF
mmetsp:Transcript_26537/g.39256  ORF Transcript_26537/g.39256 Transcript_26537/m.39256 type:complete len:403 (+) Transcript_26537:129-1337(+)